MSYQHDLAILSRSAATLAARFDGTFGVETVERLLHESYDLLASTSKVNQYLPLLAERFAAASEPSLLTGGQIVTARSRTDLPVFQRFRRGV